MATTYDAFISYSHAADGQLAPRLQAGLHRLAKPLLVRRAMRVFRDESGLTASPHLWDSIATALASSEWFVLLASPESATSPWVDREVKAWLADHPIEQLLIVITGGEIEFVDGALVASSTNCLPATLVEALHDEPRWLDLRWASTEEQLDLRNGRFRAAVADLAAPIRGMSKEDLESDDVIVQRRARRSLVAGVAAISILAVASVIATTIAIGQRDTAQEQRTIADAQRLSALSTSLTDADLSTSLLLAVEGWRLHDDPETRGTLYGVLGAERNLAGLHYEFPNDVDLRSSVVLDANHVAIPDEALDKGWQIWDIATRSKVVDTVPIDPEQSISNASASLDGTLLVIPTWEGDVYIQDVTTGDTLHTIHAEDGLVGEARLSPDNATLYTLAGDLARVRAWDVASGAMVAERGFDAASGWDVVVSPDGASLAVLVDDSAPDSQVWVLDADDLTNASPPLKNTGYSLNTLAWNADGTQVAVGSANGRVLIVDAARMEMITNVVVGSFVLDVEFAGANVLAATETGDISLLNDGAVLSTLRGSSGAIYDIAHFADQTRVLAIGANEVLDFAYPGEVPGIDFVGDGSRLAWSVLGPGGQAAAQLIGDDGMISGEVAVWELASGEPVATFDVPADHKLEEWNAGGLLASGPNQIALWNVADGEREWSLDTDDVALYSTLSPDGSRLAYADIDDIVHVVTIGDRSELLATQPPDFSTTPSQSGYTDLVWSGDGQHLYAATGTNRSVIAYESDHLDAPTVLGEFDDWVSAIVLDQNGTRIAVSTDDGTVAVLDAATGEAVHEPLHTGAGGADHIAWQPEHDVIALVRVNSLSMIDVSTMRQIGPEIVIGSNVTPMLGFLDADRLAYALYNAVDFKVRATDPAAWADAACELAGRNLSPESWARYMPRQSYRATCPQWPSDDTATADQ